MKRSLPILSIVVLITGLLFTMTACQSKKTSDDLVLSATDTTGLSEFTAWKVQNEKQAANVQYVQGYKDAMATQAVSRTTVVRKVATPVAKQPVAAPAKKKGWSKAAKGTAIGVTTGAVAGAIISKKNRVLGGVIGGILGGGIGYGIGRSMDKKDGRY